MNRSNKIVLVSHCLLNANAKVYPLAGYPGVLNEAMSHIITDGYGIVQLPCPESSYLGLNRWGMCKEQYDTPNFRRHCRTILQPTLDSLESQKQNGCKIIYVIGADGSPNCGVKLTPSGYDGGVLSQSTALEQLEKIKFINGRGIFMEELEKQLEKRKIDTQFVAVDERNPTQILM